MGRRHAGIEACVAQDSCRAAFETAEASHTAHDAASRLRVYLEIKDAFEQFIRYLRRNNLLERAAGDS